MFFFLSWSLLNELFFKSLKSTGFTGSRGAKSRVDLVEDRESVFFSLSCLNEPFFKSLKSAQKIFKKI